MIGVDLFCGAGGMSLGATQAGVDVVLAVDSDRNATATYSANHPSTVVLTEDIRRLTRKRILKLLAGQSVDVIFGGPPCQGFSYSNLRTRSTANTENWLFREFLRVVRIIEPPWVIFENVRGLVNTAGGVFFHQVTDALKRAGYAISHAIPNAKYFGVPQDRARLFICGSREGTRVNLPTTSRCKAVTVKDAIRDLPTLSIGAATNWLEYRSDKPSHYARRLRNGVSGCTNHLVSVNSHRVVARYCHIPQGGNWEDIPARLMRNYKDRSRCHTGIYHRLRADQPSIVIGNFRKNMLIHPTQNRGLSVREAARLQSFPDSYVFCGSIGFQQQQVGNAVPPRLAEAIFRAVLEHR
jgi:DNA (cytosine-5)-methyltransferase 1